MHMVFTKYYFARLELGAKFGRERCPVTRKRSPVSKKFCPQKVSSQKNDSENWCVNISPGP